jgi:hypothetical protein
MDREAPFLMAQSMMLIPLMWIYSIWKVRLTRYFAPLIDFNFTKFRILTLIYLEAPLFNQSCYKFNFSDFNPYTERHIVLTKNAVRVYENKTKALSTYGKPIIAIPLSAVEKVERIKFDYNDDTRMEGADERTSRLNKNLFELMLKDEFLPIYTH